MAKRALSFLLLLYPSCLDQHNVLHPGLSAVARSVRAPEKMIRGDRVVAHANHRFPLRILLDEIPIARIAPARAWLPDAAPHVHALNLPNPVRGVERSVGHERTVRSIDELVRKQAFMHASADPPALYD